MSTPTLKAPFPWFGGKSRVAHLVWDRFGNVPNYVEPFFGSGAVLLARPYPPGIETLNDKDCLVANFWRSVQQDPDEVARHADNPVNEADQHARHLWLVQQEEFRERMKTEPDFYDAKIAGWWVWGQCIWIGSGWCSAQLPHLGDAGKGVNRQRPHLGNAGTGSLGRIYARSSGTPPAGAHLLPLRSSSVSLESSSILHTRTRQSGPAICIRRTTATSRMPSGNGQLKMATTQICG